MKKYITVILKQKNKTQDPHKRIKKVTTGYAFNYLIPKKLAEVATKGKIRHLSMLHSAISKNQNLVRSQNMKFKRKLEKAKIIHIRKKSSPSNLIFGSISEQDIISQIFQLTGQKLEKKRIAIKASKKLGKHIITVMSGDDSSISLDLHILPKTA